MAVGVFIVVAVVALVIFLVSKVRRRVCLMASNLVLARRRVTIEPASHESWFFRRLRAALLLAGVSLAGAQQLPPRPPPQPPPTTTAPPAPAALSVPDPFAGFHPGPRDLYQSPDGSDRFQHLSRYPAPPPPVRVSAGVYFPGPYYYPFGYAQGIPGPYETSWRRRTGCRWRRPICDASAKPPAAAGAADGDPTAQVFVDGYYVGLAEEFGLGRTSDQSGRRRAPRRAARTGLRNAHVQRR